MEQPTSVNSLKSRTSPSRTNPVISDIMGKLNHHSIDNGDVKFPLQTFKLNLPMTQFQIKTPLQLNQLMMMKWIIS